MTTHSIDVRIADGATNTFSVNFSLGFLSRSNVQVFVDGEVDGQGTPVPRDFTWLSDSLITVSGATIPADTRVDIVRTVSKTALFNNFEDGDPLIEKNIDGSLTQLIHLVHEVLDGRFGTFVQDIAFEGSGHRIRNMLDPLEGGDGVNLSYLNTRLGDLLASINTGGGGGAADPLLLSSGAVAQPTYSFGNSTNSGMYYDPASQSVKVGSNGREGLAVRSDGDVSLGQNIEGNEALRVISTDGSPVRLEVFPSTTAGGAGRIKAHDGSSTLTNVGIDLQPVGLGNVRIGGMSYLGSDVTASPFSMKNDGSSDCSQKLRDMQTAGHLTILFPPGAYRFDTPVVLLPGTRLIGAGKHLTTIEAGGAYWVQSTRTPAAPYDWSRTQVTGFHIEMTTGGIQFNGHECHASQLLFSGGAAGAWCIELNASNECTVTDVSGGYGGGTWELLANGIRWAAQDTTGDLFGNQRTVNYGDGTISQVEFKGKGAGWIGIELDHESTDASLGVINNITITRAQLQAPAPGAAADTIAAGSVYAYLNSYGLKMHRASRNTIIGVDVEGTHFGMFVEGTSADAFSTGACRNNAFLGCQCFNSTVPFSGADDSGDMVNVGSNLIMGGQGTGPLQPVGVGSTDFTGRRGPGDMFSPGAIWFARPNNGIYKGFVRYGEDECFYFGQDYQHTGKIYDGMPKSRTPQKAFGIRVGHSANEAHLFRPSGFSTGEESRIKIGNGQNFTMGHAGTIAPLHRVEIADPLYLTQWTGALPTIYGSNVPGLIVNVADSSPIGTGQYFNGPGLYVNVFENGAQSWQPLRPKPGYGRMQKGRSGDAYSIDRLWAGKINEFNRLAASGSITITCPADVILAEEANPAAGNSTSFEFKVRLAADNTINFVAGTGVLLYGPNSLTTDTTVSFNVPGMIITGHYVRTGAGTAEIYFE